MSNTVARGLAALALGGLVSLAAAPPAHADPCPTGSYPPSSSCIPAQQSSTVAQPGKTVTFVFTGFKPSSTVDLYLHSVPYHLGVFTADTAGTVTVPVQVPAGFAAGAHTVTASGLNPDGTRRTMVAALEVAATPAAGLETTAVSEPSLPLTGFELGAVSLLGAGLLGAGSLAVVGSRRRRREVAAV